MNPVPRMMLAENLTEELLQWGVTKLFPAERADSYIQLGKPHVHLPFSDATGFLDDVMVAVEIRVPRGLELARYTLNPRLGIMGGISILGTTGIVKPFSHEAYQETIQAELSVAVSNGCRAIVFSTGGKSERFARQILNDWPEEAFVQIADFFAFALEEVAPRGFERGGVERVFRQGGEDGSRASLHPCSCCPPGFGPLGRAGTASRLSPAFCHRTCAEPTRPGRRWICCLPTVPGI